MRGTSPGFTLFEVMIIALLLGIVAAVAVPSINNTFDEMKLNGAAREVVSALYYAQSISIKEGKDYKVQFQIAQNRFSCQESLTSLKPLHPADKKPYEIDFDDEGYIQGVTLISAIFGISNKSSVKFNSLGEADDSGSVVLGYGGFQKTITVSSPSGKVSVN